MCARARVCVCVKRCVVLCCVAPGHDTLQVVAMATHCLHNHQANGSGRITARGFNIKGGIFDIFNIFSYLICQLIAI